MIKAAIEITCDVRRRSHRHCPRGYASFNLSFGALHRLSTHHPEMVQVQERIEIFDTYITCRVQQFLSTCERVLYGLVPGPERRLFIEQPHSSRWKDRALDQKLRRRLQHAYTPYMESIDDMTEAIEDLRDGPKLDIDLQVSPVMVNAYSC